MGLGGVEDNNMPTNVNDQFASYRELQPYNQVRYGINDDIALITGSGCSGKYPISVIGKNGQTECHHVSKDELKPIKLEVDDGERLLIKCIPDEVSPFKCTFSSKNLEDKITFYFYTNYCQVTKDGKETLKGIVSEWHVLQNIIKDILGFMIYLPIK